MLYHPDKHRDPELKRQAEQLFNQVHQAYEGEEAHRCKAFSRYSWTWEINCLSLGSVDVESWKWHAKHVHKPPFPLLSAEWCSFQSYLWHLWEERAGGGRLGGMFPNIIYFSCIWVVFRCYVVCLHHPHFVILCRWWRGRGHQQKFERNMKGYRERERRGDCSKEQTLRFAAS